MRIMNAARALWANDLRHIVRDRTVSVLLFVPLILILSLRFAVPVIERQLPIVSGYRPLVLALFCMIAIMFPAFMMSLLMLDEKDQDLFAVFRVLPISPLRFLLDRLVLVAALGFLDALALVAGSGLVAYALPVLLCLAALCALMPAAATLLIVSVAGNKIEGLTVIKGLFPLILLPAAGLVVKSSWTILFAVFPAYWIYVAFAAPDGRTLALACTCAVALHGVLIAVFYRRFRRRVFP
jgi:fluoroquinolone transport system permease protein